MTKDRLPPEPGVFIYNNLDANSQPLKDLYHACDIFALPTFGDTFAMVLSEAGASGMAIISTSMAAIPEFVRNGETGLTVSAGERQDHNASLHRGSQHPEQRYHRRFVADFIGSANFLHVERVRRQWQLGNGLPIEVDPTTDIDDGHSKIALLRPEAIRLDDASAPTVYGQNRAHEQSGRREVSGPARRVHRRGRRGSPARLFPHCACAGKLRNSHVRRARLPPRR